MRQDIASKVQPEHLQRGAYLYVRQSTPRQVFENQESTKRQYALKDQALRFGWDDSQVQVIDGDLGQSGASAAREGFRSLVSDVSLGRAGIVMGLEVSRLARDSVEWHNLLRICALTQTLILDEEGVYDPTDFNDRLLLGLKGTMSEAELHLIHARLQGGLKAKAKRGELKFRLPIGFVYDNQDRIVLDPDKRIRESVLVLFQTFRRVGGVCATVREFERQGLTFPKRIFSGPHKGEVTFSNLTVSRAIQVLRNPRYAGAYVWGIRKQLFRGVDQKPLVKYVGPEQWRAFIKDAHEGYISWEDYQDNLRCLAENRKDTERKCAPREGPALLQGLAICGFCGRRMSVRYHTRRGKVLSPDYCCRAVSMVNGPWTCQAIYGYGIEQLIGEVLLEKMKPAVLEVALAVEEELQARIGEADRLRFKHVEQAHFEAEHARKRYLAVDPANRLVADELEADWNVKLRTFRQTRDEYERKREEDRRIITEDQRKKILELCTDFPRLWNSEATPDRERKRMVRLLIEDVTLTKDSAIKVQIRYKGGALETHHLPLPKNAFEEKRHSPEVIAEIDKLLENHTDAEVADILNEQGALSGTGKSFTARRISTIRRAYNIRSHFFRLRKKGLLTIKEICEKYGVSRYVVYRWRKHGNLKAYRYDDVGRYLYEPLGIDNTLTTGDAV